MSLLLALLLDDAVPALQPSTGRTGGMTREIGVGGYPPGGIFAGTQVHQWD
jgi:hypothetical protein